jgi:hypothetical protein
VIPSQYVNPTQNRYHAAIKLYTERGLTNVLKRQWQYIREPDQKDILVLAIFASIGVVTYCTYKGVQYGIQVADQMHLKDIDKQIVVVCGGGIGFATGVTITLAGNGLLIQHSRRLEDWKNRKIDKSLEILMKEEFENDPILSQFMDAISQRPIFLPARTPSGNVFDYDSLLGACDDNGFIL